MKAPTCDAPLGPAETQPAIPVPPILSSLLNRTRTSLLVLLVLVLPLQSVVQWVVGVNGHRHVHMAAIQAAPVDNVLSRLARPLRAVVDSLHAGQDMRLSASGFGRAASSGPAAGMHQHGGVFHQHSADTHDAVDVGDAGDDSGQGGATAFLAWLPGAATPRAGQRGDHPAAATAGGPERVVAPPRTPPRG